MSNGDGKRRPRIDWDAAFAFFCSDPTISYPKVSRQFSVSVTSVGKHARAERWNERRAELHAKAAAKLDDGTLRTLQERNKRTLQLVDKAREHLLGEKADDPKWSDLAPLVKLEQLIEGEATDRVSVAEVSQFALELSRGLDQLVMRLVAEHLPNGKRRLFVEAWREGQGEVLDRSSAGLALEAGEQS